MNFVLDASIALSWCFEDEGGAYAVAVLESLQASEAVASSLWPLEVVNGLVTAERKQRIDAAAAQRFGRLLLALPIAIERVARRRAFADVHALARRHRLTSYDAAYLELAMRLNLPLASLDEDLNAAADEEGVVRFAPG